MALTIGGPSSSALSASFAARTYEPHATQVTDPNAFRGDTATDALALPTYDGGNEITHPSVLFFPEKFAGWRYVMAATPYDGSDSTRENPCIYVANDPSTVGGANGWQVPAGLTNPIDAHPGGTTYNSDTHLALGPDRLLYCFYRKVEPTLETIYFRSTSDLVTWSAETTVMAVDRSERYIISPVIFHDGTQWACYTVDAVPATSVVNRQTAPSLTGTWSAVTQVSGITANSGKRIWHIDGHVRGGETVLLVNDTATATSGGSSADLYLAVSRDGVNFTTATQTAIPRKGAWHGALYRSALIPSVIDGQPAYELIYSGIHPVTLDWKIGYTRLRPAHPLKVAADLGAAISAAIRPLAPYKCGDTFARANGALGTSDSGHAWTGQANTANLAIANRTAGTNTASNSKAVIDAGTADGYFEVAVSALGNDGWLMFRNTDTNNYWRLGFATNTGSLQLQKIVAGAVTALLGNLDPYTTGARLGVRCSGSAMTVYRDGLAVAEVTDSFNATATLIGWQTADPVTRFSHIYARSLVGGQ